MSDLDVSVREPIGRGPADAPVLLEAVGVTKSYQTAAGTLDVLSGVDLAIREGEILAILGKSGCGKSTLLHVLGWLDEADSGHIIYDGQDRSALPNRERAALRNRVMGFVFQFYHLMPELTALENVMLPAMIRHGGGWRGAFPKESEWAAHLLERVGLADRVTHKPRHLSGGERQRVAIARALMNEPGFLFCDEPTGNLDGRTADDVRAVLWELNAENKQTMVVVTHDAKLAAQAHRIVHLVEGRVDHDDGLAPVQELDI